MQLKKQPEKNSNRRLNELLVAGAIVMCVHYGPTSLLVQFTIHALYGMNYLHHQSI